MGEACLENYALQIYLESHGIEKPDACRIFTILEDADKRTLGVTCEEFSYGCLHHARSSKSIDMHELLAGQKSVMRTLMGNRDATRTNLELLKANTETMTTQFTHVRDDLEVMQE